MSIAQYWPTSIKIWSSFIPLFLTLHIKIVPRPVFLLLLTACLVHMDLGSTICCTVRIWCIHNLLFSNIFNSNWYSSISNWFPICIISASVFFIDGKILCNLSVLGSMSPPLLVSVLPEAKTSFHKKMFLPICASKVSEICRLLFVKTVYSLINWQITRQILEFVEAYSMSEKMQQLFNPWINVCKRLYVQHVFSQKI